MCNTQDDSALSQNTIQKTWDKMKDEERKAFIRDAVTQCESEQDLCARLDATGMTDDEYTVIWRVINKDDPRAAADRKFVLTHGGFVWKEQALVLVSLWDDGY